MLSQPNDFEKCIENMNLERIVFLINNAEQSWYPHAEGWSQIPISYQIQKSAHMDSHSKFKMWNNQQYVHFSTNRGKIAQVKPGLLRLA